MPIILGLLAIFLPILTVGGYFAVKQNRLNRTMDAMDDSRRQAGYVGPNIGGPY